MTPGCVIVNWNVGFRKHINLIVSRIPMPPSAILPLSKYTKTATKPRRLPHMVSLGEVNGYSRGEKVNTTVANIGYNRHRHHATTHPAASAAVERVFSTAGIATSGRSGRLSGETLETKVLLQGNKIFLD